MANNLTNLRKQKIDEFKQLVKIAERRTLSSSEKARIDQIEEIIKLYDEIIEPKSPHKRMKLFREMRIDVLDSMDKLRNDVEFENRELNKEEQKRMREFEEVVDALEEELKGLEKQEKISLNKVMKIKKTFEKKPESESESKYLDFEIKTSVPVNRAMPATDFVLRNYDIEEEMQKVDVYSVIAGLGGRKYQADSPVNGALDEVQRSLSGSALLNPFLSAQLLDGGLAKSRLVQAGMKTFVMEEGSHKFAKITQYPELEWKAELAATTERSVVFSPVTFEAKTLRGWIQIGGETLMDAMNIEQQLRTIFSRAIAYGVDSAGLFGAGGEAPLGITNYVGVPTVAWDTALGNYDAFLDAQKLVWDENGPDLSATILSPRALIQLAKLKGTNELQPVAPPSLLQNHKFLQTSKIAPNGDDETIAVMGGFESLNLGVRLQAEIMLTPVVAETFGYKMLAVFRGDLQPSRVEDFAVITGVTPPVEP